MDLLEKIGFFLRNGCDMGEQAWLFVVAPDHPLAALPEPLSAAQIAALQYHGGLQLVRSEADAAQKAACQALVTTPKGQATLSERVDLPQWAFKASVWRLDDRRERLLVYRRVGG